MADKTGIEWTDATWNPVTGCDEVSPGCDRCYAKTFAERWRGIPGHHFENGFDVQLRPDKLALPLRWTRPRRVFVNSMSDLFHKDIPDEYIARVFAVMAACPQHTFQLLTKRHARMRALLSSEHFRDDVHSRLIDIVQLMTWEPEFRWPLPNVWLGVSVENQQWADIRIPALLETPAAVRFLSCEPLLGPVDLQSFLFPTPCEQGCGCRLPDDPDRLDCACDGDCCMHPDWPFDSGIDWVIVGGESGHGARPMDPDWARLLRDQCTAAGVAFHFKQWGEWAPTSLLGAGYTPPNEVYAAETDEFGAHRILRRVGKKAAGRELDGRTWDEYPQAAST